MDKTGIIVISLCVALLMFWVYEQKKENDRWVQHQREFALTNKPAMSANLTNAPALSTTNPSPSPSIPPLFSSNAPESLLVVSNADVRYTFTSQGGGLKTIELLKYPETISPRWKRSAQDTNAVASLNTRAPVPVLSVLGDEHFLGDGNFALRRTADGVRAEKTLPDGLRLVKEFHLGTNYLFTADLRFENVSGKVLPLSPQEIVVGTATPMDADDRTFSFYGGAMYFDGAKAQNCAVSYFNTNQTMFFVFHRTVKTEYEGGTNNVLWAAAHNQYFALLAMTKNPAQEMVARPVTLPPLADSEPSPIGIQTALIFPAVTLTTNAAIDRQLTFYAGPKEYRTLAKIGDQNQNHADEVMNWGTGFSSFFGIGSFFAKVLLSCMNALHDLTRLGYGLVIVLLTVLLRALFWPLTAKSMRSMKKMQALAPELKVIQDKYKDDVQKLFQKRNELLKKHNVSQLSGCLPMLIQMPVFFGFFTMIRSAIELRGAHFLWVADLSKPDTLFIIPGLTMIPFISTPQGLPLNLLPLLMVAVMIWQAHLQPPSPGMDPSQQRMMRFMPLILLFILYNYSAGMALYMTVSTSASVLQTWLLNKSMTASLAAPALTSPPKKRK